jgi:3-methyladenine DNA glycosylase AlkC
MENKEKFSLKDYLFNIPKVEKIAGEIHSVYPDFNKQAFIDDVISEFPKLELKARIDHIRDMFHNYLPDDYETALKILLQSLPAELDPEKTDDDFGDFIYAPHLEFVARFGIDKKYLELSLTSIKEMTKRFSAENAIRFFINAHPEETLAILERWSNDDNYHVRRLCSEGTRPKLPWSPKINIPAERAVPILDNLFYDKTRYVTRSVANHLNDISKKDKELVLKILKRWKESKKQNDREMNYIINHALRTLIKEGDPDTMKFLGLKEMVCELSDFRMDKKVEMNSRLNFSFELKTDSPGEIILDYVIWFINRNGSGKKVFKLKRTIVEKGEALQVKKSHLLIENMTTRKLFRGAHRFELQLNGKVIKQEVFELI